MSNHVITVTTLLILLVCILGAFLWGVLRPRSRIITEPPKRIRGPTPMTKVVGVDLATGEMCTCSIDWRGRFYDEQAKNLLLIAQHQRDKKPDHICDLCGQTDLVGQESVSAFDDQIEQHYFVHVDCFKQMTIENVLYLPIKASRVGLLLALARADRCFQYKHMEEVLAHTPDGNPIPVCRFCRQKV